MSKEYPPVKSGEWVRPQMSAYRMMCCDCGLVHVFEFKVKAGHVYIRAHRDNRATGQIRRHMKKVTP